MGKKCPDSLTGVHLPDEVEIDYVDEDEEVVHLDFVCEACGAEGSAIVSIDDIKWGRPEEEEEEDEALGYEDDDF